tara:strand:+ start:252 stop:1040 length:789 start_codon:yes stop_codon:yes gene_type:complete
MYIKIYILTYNNNYILNEWCLKTLFNSDIFNYKCQINVINNHSNIKINEEYSSKVNLLNNILRPDFSCGHIAKDWNAAIVNGFKDLNNPDCDIVICVQNDEKFKKNWATNIIDYHTRFDFITFGSGDGFMSFKPNAIKNIGLFDERFLCGKQEHDYFVRAMIYHTEKSSINDHTHKYILNSVENNVMEITLDGNDKKREKEAKDVVKSYENYQMPSRIFFKIKWGEDNIPDVLPKKAQTYSIMLYPYFEKNILTLKEQSYIS